MKIILLFTAFFLIWNLSFSQKQDNKLTYICKSTATIQDSSVSRIDTLDIIIDDNIFSYKKNGILFMIIDYKEKISYNFQESLCFVEELENEEKINSGIFKKMTEKCVDDSIKCQINEKYLETKIYNKCGCIYINCEKDTTLKINQMYLVNYGDIQYSKYFCSRIINELKLDLNGLMLEYSLIKKDTINNTDIKIPNNLKIWNKNKGKYVKYKKKQHLTGVRK